MQPAGIMFPTNLCEPEPPANQEEEREWGYESEIASECWSDDSAAWENRELASAAADLVMVSSEVDAASEHNSSKWLRFAFPTANSIK
jgi:hypothetical protein